jgi:hypothetical protein
MRIVVRGAGGSLMVEPTSARRGSIKKAADVAPAVLTLVAGPSVRVGRVR